MRTARLVGLSPDGKALIVATDSGEELAIVADERLRAAVRGDRPRLGQLEIEMESALSPRDIQTRIRAGQTLDDVARVAGIPMERVERFAAPVLAEREHIAAQAMSSSVRRRGETSGHRSLRITVTERLLTRGVDIDTIAWDSHRLEDSRWAVTADYRSGDAARHATFIYDPRARFSVASDDEARWLLGEHSAARGPQPGRRRGESAHHEADSEPTLDLSDDLALVRATQEPAAAGGVAEDDAPGSEAEVPDRAGPRLLRPVADLGPSEVGADPGGADPAGAYASVADGETQVESGPSEADESSVEPDAAHPVGAEVEAFDEESPIGTLYEMLGGDGYAEDSPRVYAGLREAGFSDATAVPETAAVAGWEPAIVVNYPVEPSLTDDTGDDARRVGV